MKYCPICQRTYADVTLRFCLHDGGALALLPAHDPEATLVAPVFPAQPTRVVPLAPPTTPDRSVAPVYPTAPPVTSGGAWGWKIAVAVLVLALGGVLGWALLLRDGQPAATVAQTTGDTPANPPAPTPKRATPTPTAEPVLSATPLVEELTPDERETAENDISDTLNEWSGALNDHDLDAFLSHYADRLEVYYRYRNWTRGQVREDKARAFEKYYELEGNISELRIVVEPSGRRATATFLKTYYFKGEEKDFSGSTRAQMTLIKGGGAWLIAGERDL